MNQKFGKEYKLCSQKAIEHLFQQQTKVRQFPFVMHYAVMELATKRDFQVVISAPKRIFRKAHDRNRIKRLMREVLRKNKAPLESMLQHKNVQVALFFIYTQKEELDHDVLQKKMKLLLEKLIKQLNNIQHENLA